MYKEFLEIVGNGSSTGSVLVETIAVSARYNKRGKMTESSTSPNSFMQQNERKTSRTRSPRGRSPSGRMSRWPCNACSTRPRVVAGLEKSAHMHIVRLINSLVKGPKRMMTKVQ